MDAAYSDGFQNEDDDNVILIGEESDDDRVDVVRFSDVKMYVSLDGDDNYE